jgi:hypothetical protein
MSVCNGLMVNFCQFPGCSPEFPQRYVHFI